MLEFHIWNLYTKVDKKKATKVELTRLSELLSVKVEGAWFSRQYKMGRWDGKKHFFNRGTSQFYSGLLGYVRSNLSDIESVEIDERKHVERGNLPLFLNGIELWDYQKEAVRQAIERKRGIIAAPTNSGKTEIACGIIKVLGLPANFITHRRRLLWQTKKRFEERLGIEVGIVGDQEREIKDVNILSIHTIAKRLKEEDLEITELLANTPVIFSDECFTGNTKVLIDTGLAVPIKEIYDSNLSYVLSYNHTTESFEKKEIVRKIKKPVQSGFYLQITVKYGDVYKKICCTPNHKIFSLLGYIQADKLKIGDTVKLVLSDFIEGRICKKCGQVVKKGYIKRGLAYHDHRHPKVHKPYATPEQVECKKCGIAFGTRKEFTTHHMNDHYMKTDEFSQNVKKAGRIRGDKIFGKNNPSKNPITKQKMSAAQKKWWASLPEEEQRRRISIYQNAPYNCYPTSLEKSVINFGIPDLEYVGDGKFYRRFKKGKHKNPDFLYRKEKKVIEVGDTIFWHKSGFDEIKKGWEEIGYECLALGTEDFKDENLKGRIEKFLFNHEGMIVNIKKHSAKKTNYVYNLEVEGNHNYFVEGVLASNCHHVSSASWETCLKACKSAHFRFGLSATPLMRDSVSNFTVLGLTGDEIVTVSDQELTEWGISAYPSVFLYNINTPKFPKYYPYDRVYEEGVIHCIQRNNFIVETAKRWTSIGKSVFIVVFRIQHGDLLTELLNSEGVQTEFISGKGKANDDSLDRFSRGKLPCIVSSNISDEGLDVPAIDVLIIAVEDESALKVVQRVGRGRRRKKEGENVVIIVDFIHTNNPYLKKHSRARLEQYYKMGIKMYEVKDPMWQHVEELG